jgi:hypothetical protein
MAVAVNITVAWVVTPCSLVDHYQRYRGMNCSSRFFSECAQQSTRLHGVTFHKTVIFISLYASAFLMYAQPAWLSDQGTGVRARRNTNFFTEQESGGNLLHLLSGGAWFES